jgi:cytochrome c553
MSESLDFAAERGVFGARGRGRRVDGCSEPDGRVRPHRGRWDRLDLERLRGVALRTLARVRSRRGDGPAGAASRRRVSFGYLIIAALAAWLTPVRATEAPAQFEPHIEACAPCHGAQGQGTGDAYFPRLAGKPAEYLFNQLAAFKSGRRKYPPMNYLLEFQNEAFLQQIAGYFAAQRPPLPDPAVADASEPVLAHGKSLVTQGDFDKGIPACSSCHGPRFTGMEPAIPGLIGLKAGYLSAQLGAWRYGIRTAAAPDCMQLVAARLTEDDVKAVAAWLSSQPAPSDPSPAAKGSYPLPFACGSEPN